MFLPFVGPEEEKQKDMFSGRPSLLGRILLADPVMESSMHAVMKGHFTTSHISDGNSLERIFLVKARGKKQTNLFTT